MVSPDRHDALVLILSMQELALSFLFSIDLDDYVDNCWKLRM